MRRRTPSTSLSRRLSSSRSCRASSSRICSARSPSSAPAPLPAPRRRSAGSRPRRASPRATARMADSEDALSATSRLVDIEHAADRAERAVTQTGAERRRATARAVSSCSSLPARSERASDRLALVGHVLHDHVMAGSVALTEWQRHAYRTDQTGASEGGSPEAIGAKAAILARVAGLGLPVPPAFVLPIELGAAMSAGDQDAERDVRRLSQGRNCLPRGGDRLALRRSPQAVARIGPLGRRALDAGHAGHGARRRLHGEATRGSSA